MAEPLTMLDGSRASSHQKPQFSLRQKLLRVLAFVVLGVILAWAIRHLDWHALVRALRESDWRYLILAGVVNVAVMAVQSGRWWVLLQSLGRVSYRCVASALILSFATSSIVPARAGELVRVHLLGRWMRTGPAAIAGTIVLDHVVNGISIIPLIALVPVLGEVPAWMQKSLLIVLAVVCTAGILAWLSADPSAAVLTQQSAWRRTIARLRHGLAGARSPGRMSQAAGLALLAWIAEVLVLWLSLRAFDDRFGLAVAILALVSVNIAIAIPSPPANFGTLEVGAVLVLVAFGMNEEAAVAFALAYHVLQLVSVWLLALPAWWYSRRQVSATA